MARANDNWERLMGAVMRRNKLWEMFHARSRTPSMSSAGSSMDDPFLDLSDDKFESRRYVDDQNLEALTRDEIYGAQGIGKTTMARRIGEMVKKEGILFDEVIMSHDGDLGQYGKFNYGYASSRGKRSFMGDFYKTRIVGVDGEVVGLFGVFDGHGGARAAEYVKKNLFNLGQYGKFSYGYASSRGRRSFMGDFYKTRIVGVDGEVVGLFGVFDGHDGALAAEYVKKNLFSNLIRHPKFISDTKSAIADAYRQTDRELLNLEDIHNMDVGSTACTAIVVADRLLVANVGDSRAVICRAGKAIAVSEDHKPHRRDERLRIQDAGGIVMWTGGSWTVGGLAAVSRAFGHILVKQYVVADPEIEEEKVDETLELLILASNGLWDVVSNEEAVSMTKPIQDPEEAARMLMLEARQRASADNITIIVVRFCGSSA